MKAIKDVQSENLKWFVKIEMEGKYYVLIVYAKDEATALQCVRERMDRKSYTVHKILAV